MTASCRHVCAADTQCVLAAQVTDAAAVSSVMRTTAMCMHFVLTNKV